MNPWVLHDMVDAGDGHCDYCGLDADDHAEHEITAQTAPLGMCANGLHQRCLNADNECPCTCHTTQSR